MLKILIIRLSSIGDIIQCMGIIGDIRRQFPDAEIHWAARSDMAQTLSIDPRIDKIWSLKRADGHDGLVRLGKQLKAEKFDYVYDAHSNIRSLILKTIIRSRICHRPRIVTRSKERFKRLLLFKFGINRFEWPFIGVDSYCKPLRKWGVTHLENDFEGYIFPEQITSKYRDFVCEKCITLVPSAAWEVKRWPVSHWRSLIELLPEYRFIVLGGPSDSFCSQICEVAPDRTINMSGKSTIMESSYIIASSNVVVSGDTGFMHSADLFKIPTLALMGPTAFGFPSRPSSQIISLDLKCSPCSKDGSTPCRDAVYQRCMVEITPERVASEVRRLMN